MAFNDCDLFSSNYMNMKYISQLIIFIDLMDKERLKSDY